MAYFLTCGPLLFVLAAWANIYRKRPAERPNRISLQALGIVSANALLAAVTFTYSEIHPPAASMPPWKDPAVLLLSLLFLLAPLGMIGGVFAAARGGPKWLIFALELASLPLFLVGILAVGTV